MLKRLEKLKISVQNYVAKNKFKPEYILKENEWKLVSLLNELLEHFYTVTQQCGKNNALLSSLIPYAVVLNFFLIIKLIVLHVKIVHDLYNLGKKIQKRLSKEGFILLITAHKQTFMITTCFYSKQLLILSIDLTVSLLISNRRL